MHAAAGCLASGLQSPPARGARDLDRANYVGNAGPGKRGGRTPYRVARLPGVADDYEDANGVTVLSFAQAQDLALTPPPASLPNGPLTVAGAVAAYLNYLRDGGREQSANDAAARLQRHVLPQLGDMQVADLKPERLRGWLADLARRLARRKPHDEDTVRRSRASANRVLNMLRAVLNHAYAEELILSDSAWRRRLAPFANVSVARQRYLTIEEARRLINAAEGPFRHLIQAALYTGARYSELARLKVHDFDPDSGTVGIGKSKAGKPRRIHLTEEGEFSSSRSRRGGPAARCCCKMLAARGCAIRNCAHAPCGGGRPHHSSHQLPRSPAHLCQSFADGWGPAADRRGEPGSCRHPDVRAALRSSRGQPQARSHTCRGAAI